MTAAIAGPAPERRERAPRPLHVVQVSRDASLLDVARGAEPLARQRAYARELEEMRPGSRMTILVLKRRGAAGPISEPGLEILPIADRTGGFAKLLPALLRLHRARPVDVVTTQSPFEELWISLAFAWLRSVRVVGQIHFDPFSRQCAGGVGGALRRLRRALGLRSLRWLYGVRVVSRAVERAIVERGLHFRVVVLPVAAPALDRPAVPLRGAERRRAAPAGPPRILFVGSFAPRKNLLRWLEVAARVARAEPDVLFELVGEGPCEPSLRERARALGIEGRLRWLGFLPNDELDAIYRRSTALLLTSDDEGFGRVIVEAAAAGTPCVSTSTPGAAETIVADATGFVHPYDDVDGMAESLLRLVRDPALRARMGRAASSHVRRTFAPAELRRAWVGLLVAAARPDLGAVRTPRLRTPGRWRALAFSRGSLLRGLEHEAIRGLPLAGRTLDLGGGGRSDYRSLLDVQGALESANLDPRAEPTHLLDLERPLPIGDASYDHVISLNTLEHLENDEAALGEALRVLRPGGSFHFVIPFLHRVHGSPHDHHRHTAEWWERALLRHGADPDTLSIEPLVWDRLATATTFFPQRFARTLRPLFLLPAMLRDLRHGGRRERLPDGGATRRVLEVALGWYVSGTRRGDR